MRSTTPRIPRHRPTVIPVGGHVTWTGLPGIVRIAVGVLVGAPLAELVARLLS